MQDLDRLENGKKIAGLLDAALNKALLELEQNGHSAQFKRYLSLASKLSQRPYFIESGHPFPPLLQQGQIWVGRYGQGKSTRSRQQLDHPATLHRQSEKHPFNGGSGKGSRSCR